ncbi:MAG: metal-dependent hydrolase [Rhodospirillaceae bacterium]|jgi:inner membrane protein|nr:metal-dependent hydrolase [Rhodospirillaceae bacterium]MBT5241040.1 metal-dependent hydrolase [Rhodospirillaceae bacterium]MBT5564656.1 metal-dependent hydrolase [Rhodospirillaceae bacterium]
MDPLTQGALGAALAQAAPTKTKNIAIAGGLGFVAGMAADLDSLIRSSTDPLIFLEYHRHFTHSLAFIPMGGLLCALVLYYAVGRRLQLTFFQALACCTLGYGTHALLDASTSYGTMLLWPFSEDRISWSIVPIIDPVFTVPLVALCVAAALKQKRAFAVAALLWVGAYISTGAIQHSAALSKGAQIAESRGHEPIRLEAKPSFANLLVWKIIYETDDRFYVDAVRVGLAPKNFHGTSIPKLALPRDLPWLEPTTQQAIDVQRFMDFSNGFVAADPKMLNRVIDIRYSFVPNEIDPLWSIDLSPEAGPSAHVIYRTHRENPRQSFSRLWQMLVSD